MGKLRLLSSAAALFASSFLFSILVSVTNGQDVIVEEGKEGKKMTFTPPQLSEEDQYGIHMPDYLKCDACKAITYTLHSAFEAKHMTKDINLDQADVLTILDKVCTYDSLDQYGLSEDEDNKGVNRLKGPGVYEAPGAAQMGGRLPFRLMEMCEAFREADEWQMYQHWLKDGRSHQSIQDFLCMNSEFKGEDGDLDLNLCGGRRESQKGSSHLEKLPSSTIAEAVEDEDDEEPQQLDVEVLQGKRNQQDEL